MRKSCVQHVQHPCTALAAFGAQRAACGKSTDLYEFKPLVVPTSFHSLAGKISSVIWGFVPTFHSAYIKSGKTYKHINYLLVSGELK